MTRKLLSRLLTLSTLTFMGCSMQPHTDFDAPTWQAQRGAEPQQNKRGTMVDALDTVLRAGMSRQEVVSLLGEPDSRNTATSSEIYELGVSPVGIDEEYYELSYRDGKLTTYQWRRR